MKLKIYILIISIIGISSYVLINKKRNKSHFYHIAVLQTASHPSLDQAREGCINEIYEYFGKEKIKVTYRNGEGSVANIQSIAASLVEDKSIDMFYTIASSPTQSIYMKEKERPIIMAAVSDPYAIGIDQNKTNITGISDMVSQDTPLYIIENVIPNVKTIGLIYSMSALNENEAKKIKKHLENNGKLVTEIVINNENEVGNLLDCYLPKIECLLSLCDNIVAATAPLIVNRCKANQVAFISCFNDTTKIGGLASCGTNYEEDGKLAAKHAIKIIKNEKKPYEIPIQLNQDSTIYVNKKTAAELEIQIDTQNKNIILI